MIKSNFRVCLLILLASLSSLNAKTEENISDWNVRLEHARLQSYMKKYPESIKEYEQLLKEKPDSLEVKAELAKVLHYDGRNEEALKILENLPTGGTDDEILLIKAEIYAAKKKYNDAEEIYRVYLKEHGDAENIKFKLAELLSWQKNYEESIQLYEELLAKRPDDIQLRRKYALVLMWAGKHSQAANELEKTLPKK